MRLKLVTALIVICLSWVELSFAQSDITINGYTSFEFEKQIEDEGNGDGDPNGSFDADLFDLVFNLQVDDKVRVSADITWEHGAATEDDFGNVALEYGFVEYAFSDLFKVRAGKMFTPFGIFNEIHTAKPAFLSVKEPASTNKTERITEAGFRFFPRWAVGVALRGDGIIGGRDFSYDVLLANGDQEATNPFEEDNNSSKSVTARFRLEPSELFHLGNSFYYDKQDSGGTERLVSDGIELRFQSEAWRLLAEFVVGWRRLEEGGRVTQFGWFLQPSYHFENGMTPYFRLERVDPNLDSDQDHGYDVIAGLNYEITPGFMLKAENNYYKGAADSSLAEFPGASYNELKAAIVLGF